MLKEVELYVYDKFIKDIVVEENGVKKIFKEDLEKIELSSYARNFVMYIINKEKIKVTDELITVGERSPFVRDIDYGDIQGHDLQKEYEPAMSKIEYSQANEKVFEDYTKLDEYLETTFIPNFVILKQRKNENGEIEYFQSIRLLHIMALKLSEAELEHVMNYLNERNIRVGGKSATLDCEFDNYDYVLTYKDSILPSSIPADATLEKIVQYKQTKDEKLRQEIIIDNMRLVPYVAYKYAIFTGIDEHELESYGYEALIKAVDNFDVDHGCTFSSFAVANIRGNILNGIQKILIGKKNNFFYDYINAKTAVENEYGLTLVEAPELIDNVIDLLVATEKIEDDKKSREYARRKIVLLSLGNMSLDEDDVFEELANSEELMDTHDYAEEALNTTCRDTIEEMLHTLPAREAEILRLRFGFYDGVPKSYRKIAKIFNLSRNRVNQIEKKAITTLQRPRVLKKLRAFYDDSETERFSR